ncbi:aminotransferase-like domain-containing protein [Thalassotalea ganghwensis]
MKQYKYESVASDINQKIISGYWKYGEKLPSIRALAQQLKLSKISIQTALQLLEQRHIVEAKPKSGYYVTYVDNKLNEKPLTLRQLAPKSVKMPDLFLDIMEHSAAFDISPQYGLHHPPSKALEKLTRCLTRAHREQPYSKSVYYSTPAGLKSLREQIALHYKKRDLIVNADDICITSGCQNALYLSLQCICRPGDTVAVESPAFYGILQLLQHLGCKIIEITSSPTQGMDIDELTKAATKWPIKACIITPNFATPTGAKLPSSSQQKLLVLAKKFNFTIIEDDVYGDLGFHQSTPPLSARDREGQVILCGSLSKSLSRDLRIGWAISGKHIEKIKQAKLVQQLATSQTVQQGVNQFLAQGHYERHLQGYRPQLLRQRDELLFAIKEHWPFPVRYTVPDGGLSLWVQLPSKINALDLYRSSFAKGIIITPGCLFSSRNAFSNFIRLSFAHKITEHRLHAIQTLGQIINQT